MNKELKQSLLGFTSVSLMGTIWHFVYEWSGQYTPVGLICPVNESPWEHLKLLWFPYLLWCLLTFKKEKIIPVAWARHGISALTGTLVLTVSFYTYSGILGKNLMAADILCFIISVASTFLTEHLLRKNNRLQAKSAQTAGILLILAISALFGLFTFYPPRIPWFLDSQNGIYGI